MAEVGGSIPPVPTTPASPLRARARERADRDPCRPSNTHERDRGRLPDGRKLAVPAGTTVLEVAERIGRGSRRPRSPAASTAGSSTCACRSTRDVALEIVTDARPAGGRGDPPLGRARDGRRGEAPVPGRAGRRRPHRSLARSSSTTSWSSAPFTPDDLARIEAEMRRILAEKRRVHARGGSAREAKRAVRVARRGAEALAPRRHPRRRGRSRSSARRLRRTCAAARTCSTPSRSARSSCSRRPAPTGAATSATRCCSASTAPPSRRRRQLDEHLARLEEAKRARSPPARRAARAVPPRSALARLAVLLPEGHGALQRPGRLHARRSIRSTATRR